MDFCPVLRQGKWPSESGWKDAIQFSDLLDLMDAIVLRPLCIVAFCAAFHCVRENSVASHLFRELPSTQQAVSDRDREGEL